MPNQDQVDYWNGNAGEKWVKHSNHLDGMLAPFASAVMEAAVISAGEQVLDVGCGAGALSLMAADAVGANGAVTGVDVSAPMLGLARERAKGRAENTRFEDCDASTLQMSVMADVMISRFGVMFFDDPIAAFRNLRSSITPTGRLAFACWQPMATNDWVRVPLEVGIAHLNEAPEMPPAGTPGPFAFADPGYVETLLSEAGWQNAALTPWVGKLIMPGDAPADTAAFMMEIGPVARLLKAQDLDVAPVQAELTERMGQMVTPEGRVAMGAAAWIVTADAS